MGTRGEAFGGPEGPMARPSSHCGTSTGAFLATPACSCGIAGRGMGSEMTPHRRRVHHHAAVRIAATGTDAKPRIGGWHASRWHPALTSPLDVRRMAGGKRAFTGPAIPPPTSAAGIWGDTRSRRPNQPARPFRMIGSCTSECASQAGRRSGATPIGPENGDTFRRFRGRGRVWAIQRPAPACPAPGACPRGIG
jgi:hypothetical protein